MKKEIVRGYKLDQLIGKKIFDFIPTHFLGARHGISNLRQESPLRVWMNYFEKGGVPYMITKEKSSKKQKMVSGKYIRYDKYKLWKELVIEYDKGDQNTFIFRGTFDGRD